jgi:hypothetical protein
MTNLKALMNRFFDIIIKAYRLMGNISHLIALSELLIKLKTSEVIGEV